jgi:hypothetical protein
MRAAKTVFIVGAGASNEVGMPFGRAFLDIVSQKLSYKFKDPSLDPDSGDDDIRDVIQQYAQDRLGLDRYLDAARRIREGIVFSRSIDAFIDVHRDDERIQKLGKLAIAKTILEQEQRCHMYIAPPGSAFQDMPRLDKSWFVNFVRGLNEGVRREEIDRIFEKVSFVVFNYDRCVEHFLYNALQMHYGVDAEKAKSLMRTLTILHPYGKIADLPWQNAGGIPFGFSANRANLLMMASHIKTYTEQIEDDNTLHAIKSEVADAETLVFLGFSYLDLNMDLIHPTIKCAAQNVFGTAYGISSSDVDQIKKQLRESVGQNLSLTTIPNGVIRVVPERLYIRSDLKCAGLLEEYSRSLFATGQRSGK